MRLDKLIAIAAMSAAAATPAFAGGYFTNTNQSIAFLRQPAQNATIGVQGAYFNPAGIGFMENGWHFEASGQYVTQRRTMESSFAPFAYGSTHLGETLVKYTGKTDVPFLPNFSAAYVHDRIFASFHFGSPTGGGACEFADGLGSFEAPVATLTALFNGLTGAQGSYGLDMNLTGEQYNFGGQLLLGYRLTERLAVSAGVRMNYIYNDYAGAITGATYGGTSFGTVLTGIMSGAGADASTAAAVGASVDDMLEMEIDAHNSDIAWNPIIGIDWKLNDALNFAAKYEFRTAVRLENDADNIAPDMTAGEAYKAGTTIRADIPANLALGVQWSVLPMLRLNANCNTYFEKQANVFGGYGADGEATNKQDALGRNPWEILIGAEWDISDKWTVSAGGHRTTYDFGDNYAYLEDTDFDPSSYTFGCGFRYHFSKAFAVDFAVYKTFYDKVTKHYDDYSGLSETITSLAGAMPESVQGLISSAMSSITAADVTYSRDSFVVGLGIVIDL